MGEQPEKDISAKQSCGEGRSAGIHHLHGVQCALEPLDACSHKKKEKAQLKMMRGGGKGGGRRRAGEERGRCGWSRMAR